MFGIKKEIQNFSRLEIIFLFAFSLFIFFQCLSIAVANIFLGISIFFAILVLAKRIKEKKINDIYLKIKNNRTWFLIFGFFWAIMLLSALFSGEPIEGAKVFFNTYVFRTFPFFFILLFFDKPKLVFIFLIISIISCALDVIGGYIIAPAGAVRLKGLFGHMMTLAGFLCVSLPLCLSLILNRAQKLPFLIFNLVLFSILAVGLMLNATRGAWLGVIPALFLVGMWFSLKSVKKTMAFIVIAAICASLFCSLDQVQRRVDTITDMAYQSNSERLLMWKSATNMFLDHPILGVGVGQYADKYQKEYILPEAKERRQKHAHSNIFQMLGQSGAIGLISFVLLFGYIFWFGFKSMWRNKNLYGMLIVSVSMSFFIQGLTEFNFGNSAVVKFYWVALASLIVLSRIKDMKNNEARPA